MAALDRSDALNRGGIPSWRRARGILAFRHSRVGQGGQALVELALVVMIMVVLAMGVIDLGRGLDAFVSVTQAARDGARAGMAPAIVNDTARRDAAVAAALAVRPGATVTVTACTSEAFGVTVTYVLPAITRIMGDFTITETLVSRCRNS